MKKVFYICVMGLIIILLGLGNNVLDIGSSILGDLIMTFGALINVIALYTVLYRMKKNLGGVKRGS